MIYGGYSYSDYGSVTATGNTVSISGGTANTASAGYVYTPGTDNADASGNTLIISGGDMGTAVGAFISCGFAFSTGGSATASGNSVFITGGEVNSNVSGGFAQIQNAAGSATATGNTVTLSGAPIFAATSSLYGGQASSTGSNFDAFTDNTLNLWNYTGNSVDSIQNFEYYDFILPSSLQHLTTNTLALGDGSGSLSSVTGVNIMGDGTIPLVGDVLTLIEATTVTGAISNDGATITGLKGVSLLYDFRLDQTANALTATVIGVQANPRSKSISEGRAASLAFLRQGQDFVIDTGFAAADAFLGRTGDGWSAPAFFGAAGGGHARHKTGSHVDVDGVSTVFGAAWRNNGPCGSLLLGAFFEAGYADYETRNAFASGAVRGDGDSRYFGGGLLARYDWQNGIYVEASGRAGGVKNKFHSDLTDSFGNRAKYDIDSAYFSAHAGVGYKWRVNEKAILDLSTKYLWSRQNSNSAIVAGDPVRFDADNSHRVLTGARFSYAVNDCVSPYVGAAFEYEFDGKAHAGAYGYNYGVPSLKGGTGIGEVGVTMRRNNFSTDLGVQGHVGRRDGVTGSLRVGWTF